LTFFMAVNSLYLWCGFMCCNTM